MAKQTPTLNILDLYKEYTKETAVYPHVNTGDLQELAYVGLGLAGETGEAVDVIKKILRNEGMTDAYRNRLIDELGDVLWYWTRLTMVLNTSSEEIIKRNVEKLLQRKDKGTLINRDTKFA